MTHETLILFTLIMSAFAGGGIHPRYPVHTLKKGRKYGSGHKEEGLTGAEIIIL